MNMMNSGFINRNRIYWMNTRGIAEIKVIVNDDLFNLPDEIASKDEISINLKHSDRPLAIGVMSYMSNDIREYLAYGNDILGKVQWVEEFSTFKEGLSYAKEAYMKGNDEMYCDYMYDENTKAFRK